MYYFDEQGWSEIRTYKFAVDVLLATACLAPLSRKAGLRDSKFLLVTVNSLRNERTSEYKVT